MRIAYPVVCLIASSCLSLPALAAENSTIITKLSGKVLVTTPDGVFPAEVGQSVSDGDSIFVGDDSLARIATADGTCPLTLPPRKVTVINSATLCDSPQITPTAGEPSTGGVPPPVVGVGFFVAAAGAAAIITITDDDDDDNNAPISAP